MQEEVVGACVRPSRLRCSGSAAPGALHAAGAADRQREMWDHAERELTEALEAEGLDTSSTPATAPSTARRSTCT